MHAEEQFAIRALKSGASGYITKQSAPTELVRAIRKVKRGGKYISQSIAEQLAFFYSDEAEKPPHERLSDREFQVMRLIAEGKTLREIAERARHQRKNRRHLSRADFRENADDQKRRTDSLCRSEKDHRINGENVF